MPADVKPTLGELQSTVSDRFTIRLRNADNKSMQFHIRPTTRMRKVLSVWAQKFGENPTDLRLSFDGNKVNEDDTPEMHGLEEDDVVEVFMGQEGGAQSQAAGSPTSIAPAEGLP